MRGPSRSATAFGLELESSIALAGLSPATGDPRSPHTRIEIVTPTEIDVAWRGQTVTRLIEEPGDAPGRTRTIDEHPRAGFRLNAPGFGLAHVSRDGDLVRLAPATETPWAWQRFLIGRVLPWASVLRGHEVFHASAVEIAGSAVALLGPSGAGKTSLAVSLVLRGAKIVTDDVLAVRVDEEGVLRAHPGSWIVGIREDERRRLGAAMRGLGEREATHGGKTFVALEGAARPLPLGAVFLVTRDLVGAGESVEALAAPDPVALLSSSFIVSLQTPRRLANLLDTCALIARSVPVFQVRVRPGTSAAILSEPVHSHALAAMPPRPAAV